MNLYNEKFSNPDGIARELILGKTVIFPTETVYGLGTSLFSDEGVRRIYYLKRRPKDKPLAILISDISQLEGIVAEIPDEFILLYKYFFPGPLTVLLPKNNSFRSAIIPHENRFIGVRMPSHPIPLQLINALGHPLVATSVNYSGNPSVPIFSEIPQEFLSGVDFIFQDDPSVSGLSSTVISLNPFKILRRGFISEKEIKEKIIM